MADIEDDVRAAQRGDERAFGRLYERHAGRVYVLCRRLSGDSAHAEELTQDTFVRVWEKLDSFRGESSFGTWLHRVAVNVALAAARSRERRADGANQFDRLNLDADVAGRASTIAEILDLETAIAGLPEALRRVYVLHEIEGYSHEEIAVLLGVAASTSRVQLFQARRKLRRTLGL